MGTWVATQQRRGTNGNQYGPFAEYFDGESFPVAVISTVHVQIVPGMYSDVCFQYDRIGNDWMTVHVLSSEVAGQIERLVSKLRTRSELPPF
jgi:hypothetical protein